MNRTFVAAGFGSLFLAGQALSDTLTISAAISLKDAMADIAKVYHDDTLVFHFDSSGTLAAQIEQGAPADCFISAGVREMNQLDRDHLIDPQTEQVIATNSLVLIAPADSAHPPQSFQDLADPRFAHIAIGSPTSVPAGNYAQQVINHLHLGPSLAGRLVYGSNVRQVLDYVRRGEVDAGIVYATDADEAGSAVKVVAQASPTWHQPILYPAVVLKESAHAAAARRFVQFLASPVGQAALAAHDFSAPPATTRPTESAKAPATAPAAP